jgi:hypothetical protein
MSRRALVTILVEDQPQQRFAYRYLKRIGYLQHEIYSETLPKKGHGSGEQWVRLRYANIVEAHRRHAASPRTGVVVLIDADTGLVTRRTQQLEEELRKAGAQPRTPAERIAHLIPKRNIETWILCLNDRRPDGHPVNEDDDFKGHAEARRLDELIPEAANLFFVWSRPNAQIPQHSVASIRVAIPEIRRLD